MSRTVAAQDRNNESFAGLMEHLTNRAPRESSERKSNPATGSGFASSTGKRPVLAVTEIRQAKPRPRSEEQELSYEQALRLHGSRRLSEENEFDPPIPQTAAKTAPPATAARSGPSPNPKQSSARTQKQPLAAARKEQTTTSRLRQNRNASNTAAPAQIAPATPQKPRSIARQRHKQAAHSAAVPEIQVRRSVEANVSKTSPSSKRQRNASALTQAKAMATLNETKAAIAALEREPETHPHTLQLEHASGNRRSIISVRLNEEEFARLRTRAIESGISVSAYMRSCVLDAEHLRTQVKQALAEMRAYARPTDSSQLSALARTVKVTAENTGMWSRMIARSTTFFMGLWYPFRRNA